MRWEGDWRVERLAGLFPDERGVVVGWVRERRFVPENLAAGVRQPSFERVEWFRGYWGWIGGVPNELRDCGVWCRQRELLGFGFDAWEGWPIGPAVTDSGAELETRGWWLLRVPYWFLILAGGAWPLVLAGRVSRRQVARRRLRRATEQGICPVCGYDLRASPGRCPECGSSGLRQ